MASADKLAEYEQLIAASEIPAQIGDIKTEDLVGPSALQVPGNHVNAVLLIEVVHSFVNNNFFCLFLFVV